MNYGYFAFTRLSLDTIKKSIYIELSKITRHLMCRISSLIVFWCFVLIISAYKYPFKHQRSNNLHFPNLLQENKVGHMLNVPLFNVFA